MLVNISLISVGCFLRLSTTVMKADNRIADALVNRESDVLPSLNLKGMAIGNGWIDPLQQYPGYVDFAYEKGLFKKGSPVSLSSLSAILSTVMRIFVHSDEGGRELIVPA